MSAIKPTVDEQSIRRLLAEHLPGAVTTVRPIEGGRIARTFIVEAPGGEFVLRFNADNLDANFETGRVAGNRRSHRWVPALGRW